MASCKTVNKNMCTVSDDMILDGFRSFDEDITKEYFYGYCRRAYNIYDVKYQLRWKNGLDFYSLAHEYYIQLLTHSFKPLLNKPMDIKLSTWMVKGFHFVVLDALKAYNKEFEFKTEESSEIVLEYIRSADQEEGMMFEVAEAVASHYHDRVMQEIAHMVFFAGFKQKEVAAQLGITPAAVNLRFKKIMEEVVTPFVIEHYGKGLYLGRMEECKSCLAPALAPMDACLDLDDMTIVRKQTTMNKRITPAFITTLEPNEIFVFGSNLQGIHAGGAARMARLHFGAEMGNGVGMQGQSYAIPTMQGEYETKLAIMRFTQYAMEQPELKFLVTPVGRGIAGYTPEEIAPMFKDAAYLENVYLPISFWKVLMK